MQPLISIIVPVYNVERYLQKSVASMLNQTYHNLEIILVDDGSTDDSGKICDELAQNDSRIHVIHKKNGGPSEARNTGRDVTKGEYLIFLDPDDYIAEEMIMVLYEQLIESNSDVSVCGIMNVYQTTSTPQCSDTDLTFLYDEVEFLKAYLVGKYVPGSLCNKLLKREIAMQIDFPVDRIVFEDAYYHLELVKRAKKYVVNTKPYYHYFHRGESLTTSPFTKRDLSCIDVYQEFYDYVQSKQFPIEEAAFFRLSHAYFYVLDKMLQIEDYQSLEDYPFVLHYLKKNAIKIAKNSFFQRGRRLSALILKCHVALYRQLMLQNEKKNRQIHQ